MIDRELNNWFVDGPFDVDFLPGDDMCQCADEESGCKVATVTKGAMFHGHTEAVYLNKMLKTSFIHGFQFYRDALSESCKHVYGAEDVSSTAASDKSGISKVVVWFLGDFSSFCFFFFLLRLILGEGRGRAEGSVHLTAARRACRWFFGSCESMILQDVGLVERLLTFCSPLYFGDPSTF